MGLFDTLRTGLSSIGGALSSGFEAGRGFLGDIGGGKNALHDVVGFVEGVGPVRRDAQHGVGTRRDDATLAQGSHERARRNAATYPWAKAIQDSIVERAQQWRNMSDDALWNLMFGFSVKT